MCIENKYLHLYRVCIIFYFALSSCKKFVDVSPPLNAPDASVVYSNDATATAVLTGMYNRMSSGSYATGVGSISEVAALSADELKAYSTFLSIIPEAYANALTSTNTPFWSQLYNNIYTTNAALEGLESSSGVSSAVKQQLTGEAKFMRAFNYFYLVNLFGDVPLATTTNYNTNTLLPRSPETEVYKQIIADLKDAQNLLSSNYIDLDLKTSTSERIRPTKWAAIALLARVYLYTGDWSNAEALATEVINNVNLYSLENDLDDVFLKNSKEAIWQLQPVNSGWNTEDARVFILTSGPNAYPNSVSVSDFLYNSFDSGDNRKNSWIGTLTSGTNSYYYPYKYKSATNNTPITEYLMVLRLAEQYLIRAEARAKQNNIIGAKSDLNEIRNRADLPNVTGVNQNDILTAIEHERQVELFTEWGHRWLDLKRTSRVDAVMSLITPQKGGAWNTDWQLYPIPLATIQTAPNLTQNAGY